MTFAAWNIRTLQSERTVERRTAIIGMELDRYGIDIAALSETRLADTGQICENTSGYTFYWSGLPSTEKRMYGVAFAIRSTIVKNLSSVPKAISERLLSVRLPISKNRSATIISAYAPTMTNDDVTKEAFYNQLDELLRQIPKDDKIVLLGDFNARVGANHAAWPETLGRHGIGKLNSNGLLLLSKCKEYGLTITNTMFQLPTAHKTTWMHPRAKHWHMIDYAIVRSRDRTDVTITKVMRGAECQTDHKMIRMKLKMVIHPKIKKSSFKAVRKLNVSTLRSAETRHQLAEKINGELTANPIDPNGTVTNEWNILRDTVYNTSKMMLGLKTRKQPDWFSDNLVIIQRIIDNKNEAFRAWLSSNTQSSKLKLQLCQRRLQNETRKLKDQWLSRKAQEIQQLADRNDSKNFYDAIKELYGPSARGGAPLLSQDGRKLLTNQAEILGRWQQHFNELLNRPSHVDQRSIDQLPQKPVIQHLANEPTEQEIRKAINLLSNGKSPGEDGIPAEIFKHGGEVLITRLHSLYCHIWRDEEVPQQLKDALIVTIFKRKGSRSECGNHRGISLLSSCSKILTKILQIRLVNSILDENVSESQCGFRGYRGTTDMVFSARQLQEKCIEQNIGLYAVFVDLTKAFDTVSRVALWQILLKIGCPQKFVRVLQQLHDGMQARVCADGKFSEAFDISNGVKQGCVVAPILFVLFFATMLKEALKTNDNGVHIKFRTDGGIFNLRRLRAKTKTIDLLVRDLLFADDCGLFSHTEEGLQSLMNAFAVASSNFSLTISTKKTEVMYQPPPGVTHHSPTILVNGEELKTTKTFPYLGSILSDDGQLDHEIVSRISKASSSFGSLRERVWNSHDIKLATKIAVYRAVVVSTLLYGAQTWTVYSRHVRQLEAFQQRCLRNILKTNWEEKVSNIEILAKTKCCSIESIIRKRHLQWSGHLVRMNDSRLPKSIFYGELRNGSRKLGKPRKRFKDMLADTMRKCDIPESSWEELSKNRSQWRGRVHTGVQRFEKVREHEIVQKRLRRKDPSKAAETGFRCGVCDRPCANKAGLTAHSRIHRQLNQST